MRWTTGLIVRVSLAVAFIAIATPSRAALVVAGVTQYNVRPIQDLILAPGTAFNSGTEEIVFADAEAFGLMTFDRLAQVGSEIQLVNGRFTGSGFNAALGNFTLVTGAPNFTPMTMLLSNVVQDPSDPGFASGDPSSIMSAEVFLTVFDYGVRLDDLGIDLEVRDPFSFSGSFDGLPPSAGNMIADQNFGNNDRLEVYIAGTNSLVGWSANRRLLSAVPEPSSFAVLAFAAASGLYRWRTRRGTASNIAAC